MPDRPAPWTKAGEKETLLDFLGYLRESVILKLDGLTDERARSELVPSGTTLLGLVKHLAMVETAWFQFAFDGKDVALIRGLEEGDTVGGVIDEYRQAIAKSNEIAGRATLDDLCQRKGTAPELMTMRWVLVHLVEETARHAGHADILREQIDGTVGR